jgi:hypothetical protein
MFPRSLLHPVTTVIHIFLRKEKLDFLEYNGWMGTNSFWKIFMESLNQILFPRKPEKFTMYSGKI